MESLGGRRHVIPQTRNVYSHIAPVFVDEILADSIDSLRFHSPARGPPFASNSLKRTSPQPA
jgi:hypothetical protein